VFDIKRTGIFRARLVACGYSQIPGVDFQDYYSPVVNDAVFRIVIILQILWNLSSVIIDVETAFLHGDLNESIYMLPPKGTNIGPNQCVHLDKALYGLVQAA
jgi:Reverse transcriptase (RNA-dependent DNA polymerase)